MLNWFKEHKRGVIRGMFLIPILLVMAISISHVVSWYDIANPFSWAIYLSVAIEIAAMSSIAAASVRVKGGVWLVFIIVTLVQFIGNIFFCYNEINANSPEFKSWVELTGPIFEGLGSDITDGIAQKRWLALLEGGLLPIISLASLHFFIKYGGIDDEKIIVEPQKDIIEVKNEEPKQDEVTVTEIIEESKQEGIVENTVTEIVEEPKKASPLAINMMRKTGLR